MKNKHLNLVLLVILVTLLPISIIISNASEVLYSGNFNEYYDENDLKQTKYKFFDNTEVMLNYVMSYSDKVSGVEITRLRYKDDDYNEYTIDKNSKKLIGFTSINNLKKLGNPDIELNKSEIDLVANTTLNKFTNPKKYTLIKSSYNSEYKSYKYVWMRFINGVETDDVVYIEISANGDLLSVVIPFQGIYDMNEEELIEKSKQKKISKSDADGIIRLYLKEKNSEEGITMRNYEILNTKIYFNRHQQLVWRFQILVNVIDNYSTVQIPVELEVDAFNKAVRELV